MFSLLFANWRLIGIGAAVIALCAGVLALRSHWIGVGEARVETAYQAAWAEQERKNAEIKANDERIAREVSRELQAQLSAQSTELAALRVRSGGMQVYSYRFQPATVPAPGGLAYASQEPERAEGTRVDLERLYALADRCQSDAAQLDTLIGWARAQAR